MTATTLRLTIGGCMGFSAVYLWCCGGELRLCYLRWWHYRWCLSNGQRFRLLDTRGSMLVCLSIVCSMAVMHVSIDSMPVTRNRLFALLALFASFGEGRRGYGSWRNDGVAGSGCPAAIGRGRTVEAVAARGTG